MKKPLLSLLLILSLFLCLPGTAAFADAPGPQKGDTVYLGEYGGEPLAWQILDAQAMNTGEKGLYLLSCYVLENGLVMYDGGVARWPGSRAQDWCGAFLASAFSPLEQAALPAVSKTEAAFQGYGLSWGEVSLEGEKVFFLSTQEIADYIGANDGDSGISAVTADGTEASWWLRTPHGFHTDYAGLVMGNNQVHDFLVYGSWGVRPATNLSAQTCLFLTPADTELAVGLPAPLPASADGCWKATLLDTDIPFAVEEVLLDGDEVQVRYSGAVSGGYVSALVRGAGGELLSYARLAQAQEDNGSLTLPQQLLALDGSAALYLLSERENGPRRSNAASAPVAITIPAPEEAAPAAREEEPAAQTPAPEAPSAAPTAAPVEAAANERSFFGELFLRYGLYAAAGLGALALILGLVRSIRRARRRRRR